MSEHLIRLRAGWEGRPRDEPDAPPLSVRLPAPAEALGAFPLRLSRQFGRPTTLAGDSIRLRLRDVPGLVRVELNGRELPVTPEDSAFELTIGPLLRRNCLRLDLQGPPPSGVWGDVALVMIAGDDVLENGDGGRSGLQ